MIVCVSCNDGSNKVRPDNKMDQHMCRCNLPQLFRCVEDSKKNTAWQIVLMRR
jgi:hypothetical protein